LEVDDFRRLYTIPPESDALPPTSSKGKSAQDIYGECILRKNKGAKFVHLAGSDIFHTEEELHAFLVRSACAAVAHIDYSQAEPSKAMEWLANMPSDEEAGWNADATNATVRKDIVDSLPPNLPSSSTGPSPPTPEALTMVVAEAD
jgi:hypothetical protein